MSEPGGTARHHWAPKTVLPGPGGKGPGRAVLAKPNGKRLRASFTFSHMQVKNE